MRKFILSFVLVFSTICALAQVDTIYSSGKQIPCTIVEVGADVVKFTYPNETLQNSLYVNSIRKIIFRSGRVQEFAKQSSYRTIKSPADWENVSLSSLESEVLGLHKLGEVSSKAVGTTEFANQERVKMRAIRKLKMDAAMMGANIIYIINMRSDGNKVDWMWGASSAAETSLTGIGYTNTPINDNEVKNFFGRHAGANMVATTKFTLKKGDPDMRIETDLDLPFKFSDVINESGTVFIEGSIPRVRNARFQVVFLSDKDICLRYSDKSAVYVYKIKI